MSKLDKVILYFIFEELQEDSKSLFSCLMTNKIWCETIIPILWRDPWRYDINYYNKNYLLAIISSYIPDDIKRFLTKQGIELPQISYETLRFDYLSFCKSINVNIINKLIFKKSNLPYNQFLLQQEFYSILMRKCPELKYLDALSIKHQLFYFPGAKERLESLYELKCETSVDSSYFYGLANICQNIQRLFVFNKHMGYNFEIAKLIEVQKNLKYFEWKDDFDEEDYMVDPYNEIFLSLEKKAGVLNHLKLTFQFIDGYDHTTLLEILPKLHKLKTLIIYDECCIYLIESEMGTLVYPDLEFVRIGSISISAANSIVENSKGHLKIIWLFEEYDFLEDDFELDSLDFIRKVYKNCPLIERLSLVFPSFKEHLTEFENLLKVCQNLNTLLLRIRELINGKNFEHGEKLLKLLIKSVPKNLREIRFYSDLKFSLKALEEFFESWKGRPALTIFTTQPYTGDDYNRLINKYKDDGIIKDFRYTISNQIYNIDMID